MLQNPVFLIGFSSFLFFSTIILVVSYLVALEVLSKLGLRNE